MAIELLKWPEGKIPFIIRDDDVSFFTSNKMLQSLYEHAWSKGYVVSFSIIPLIKGNILSSKDLKEPLSHIKYEPCVPPSARGDVKQYTIQDNLELVSFLLKQKENGFCDMTLHGLSHERSEFLSMQNLVERRLGEALTIFARTFHFQPNVFVFPYDKSSQVAIQILRKEKLSFCKMPPFINRVFAKARIARFPSFRFSHNIIEFYHSLGVFSPFLDHHKKGARFEIAKDEFLKRYNQNDLFCLAHHYWEFFFDWKQHITQKDMLKVLNEFLDYVEGFNIWKCGFNEVSEWLLAFNSILARKVEKNRMILKTKLPIKNLSFSCTGVCKVQGLESEAVNSQGEIWTIKNVPADVSFEVKNA